MTYLGQKGILEDLLRNLIYTAQIRSTWTHYFLSFMIENMSKIDFYSVLRSNIPAVRAFLLYQLVMKKIHVEDEKINIEDKDEDIARCALQYFFAIMSS